MGQSSSVRNTQTFRYETLRNISSPQDKEQGRLVFCGKAPIGSFQGLGTEENVRNYLVRSKGKKIERRHAVHRAILETLEEKPEDFSVLNGGIVIVAHEAEADDKNKSIKLTEGSIINGAQTQGVIGDYLCEKEEDDSTSEAFFQIIVLTDEESWKDDRSEITIARNSQISVANISIAGARGKLDELEGQLQRKYPDLVLVKTESEFPSDKEERGGRADTLKLLQVLWAIMPSEMHHEGKKSSKTYTYSSRAGCLKAFEDIYNATKSGDTAGDDPKKKQYQFFLDNISLAYSTYNHWKYHKGIKGSGLKKGKGKAYQESKSGDVIIPDGIVFPILAALSEFFEKDSDGRWEWKQPENFDEKRFLHEPVKELYMGHAGSNPNAMGKSLYCYDLLEKEVRQIKMEAELIKLRSQLGKGD